MMRSQLKILSLFLFLLVIRLQSYAQEIQQVPQIPTAPSLEGLPSNPYQNIVSCGQTPSKLFDRPSSCIPYLEGKDGEVSDFCDCTKETLIYNARKRTNAHDNRSEKKLIEDFWSDRVIYAMFDKIYKFSAALFENDQKKQSDFFKKHQQEIAGTNICMPGSEVSIIQEISECESQKMIQKMADVYKRRNKVSNPNKSDLDIIQARFKRRYQLFDTKQRNNEKETTETIYNKYNELKQHVIQQIHFTLDRAEGKEKKNYQKIIKQIESHEWFQKDFSEADLKKFNQKNFKDQLEDIIAQNDNYITNDEAILYDKVAGKIEHVLDRKMLVQMRRQCKNIKKELANLCSLMKSSLSEFSDQQIKDLFPFLAEIDGKEKKSFNRMSVLICEQERNYERRKKDDFDSIKDFEIDKNRLPQRNEKSMGDILKNYQDFSNNHNLLRLTKDGKIINSSNQLVKNQSPNSPNSPDSSTLPNNSSTLGQNSTPISKTASNINTITPSSKNSPQSPQSSQSSIGGNVSNPTNNNTKSTTTVPTASSSQNTSTSTIPLPNSEIANSTAKKSSTSFLPNSESQTQSQSANNQLSDLETKNKQQVQEKDFSNLDPKNTYPLTSPTSDSNPESNSNSNSNFNSSSVQTATTGYDFENSSITPNSIASTEINSSEQNRSPSSSSNNQNIIIFRNQDGTIEINFAAEKLSKQIKKACQIEESNSLNETQVACLVNQVGGVEIGSSGITIVRINNVEWALTLENGNLKVTTPGQLATQSLFTTDDQNGNDEEGQIFENENKRIYTIDDLDKMIGNETETYLKDLK
jgi:hypothetical protein